MKRKYPIQLTDASGGAAEELTLAPTLVTDEGVLNECREALNKWSSQFRVAVTRKLGDDAKLISAHRYHFYSFSIESPFATRKFELREGGTPQKNPIDISQLDLWQIHGADDVGDYDLELGGTGHSKTCDHCHGQGKHVCDHCHGHREVTCYRCHGSGEENCPNCDGRGEVRRERMVNCGRCHGRGEVWYDSHSRYYPCGECEGTGQKIRTHFERCPTCGGERTVVCRGCGGSGHTTCDRCDTSGNVICGECGGRGQRSFVWHLIQKEDVDSLKLVYCDPGLPQEIQNKIFTVYPSKNLFRRHVVGTLVPKEEMPAFSAKFMQELGQKWDEVIAKFDGVADVRLYRQKVELVQYNTVIRYKYEYNGRIYLIWIDLTKGEVFETDEQGLMREWCTKLVADANGSYGNNPQKAIYNYSVACAFSPEIDEFGKRIREQLRLGSRIFRLTAGLSSGWLWAKFMGAQGCNPLSGWFIAGSMIGFDILFSKIKLIRQLVTWVGLRIFVECILPSFYTSQMMSDKCVQSYLASSVWMFIAGTLLFSRDLALRTRGGLFMFPLLGAFVGMVTAPGMYLDFAEDPVWVAQIMDSVSSLLFFFAIVRTWERYWIQNCDRMLRNMSAGWMRFELKMLKPKIWMTMVFLFLFAVSGYVWYKNAGPGVSLEMKSRAAERLLKNEKTRKRGFHYLLDAVKRDCVPAISQLAELQIMGKFGYGEEAKINGFVLATKAADRGDAKAWRLQGYCFENGVGTGRNLTMANDCYARAVKLGDKDAIALKEKTDEIASVWDPAYAEDKDAQYKLAMCYANGTGVTKDEKLARHWLLKAADACHVKSQLLIGEWLIKGIGGAKDPEAGIRYCEKAALQGSPEAIAVLGHYYFEGKVIPRDYVKAIENFNRASEKGSGSAAYMLGYCYRNGLGVETNSDKAFEYYKLADERKSLPGSYALAEAYEHGDGVVVDYAEALGGYTRASETEWNDPLTGHNTSDAKEGCRRIWKIGKYWKSAIANNDAEAQYNVGCCFADGIGVATNLEVAYTWYVKSAAQNFTDAIVHMADALYHGLGVTEDKTAAARVYERGAQANDAHSIYMLGVSYENGYGFEQNLTMAFSLFKRAAENEYGGAAEAAKVIELPARYWEDALRKKDAVAQYNLGCCFLRGSCGVEKDDGRAFRLFRMSASLGHVDAMYVVSLCYRDGIGTEKDNESWKKMLFSAAEKKHASALAIIGDLYRDGVYLEKNLTLALEYYKCAFDAGFVEAGAAIAQIDRVGKVWGPANRGDAEAQFNLGVCYRDGVQIAKDGDVAMEWFEKSSAQGNHDAEFALADMLSHILPSTEMNDKKIVSLLQKAVAADNTKAKTLLGKYLYLGKGIAEDHERSIALWEQAAKSGDLDATAELAGYHFTGRGMFNSGKDLDKALKEWKEAHQAGHIESSYRLGLYYAGGSGLFGSGKDIPKARQYFLVAAKAGHRKAMIELAEILQGSDSNLDKEEGESWLTKSKQETIPLDTVKYGVTVSDTVEEIARKIIPDKAIEQSKAAKQKLKEYETEVLR